MFGIPFVVSVEKHFIHVLSNIRACVLVKTYGVVRTKAQCDQGFQAFLSNHPEIVISREQDQMCEYETDEDDDDDDDEEAEIEESEIMDDDMSESEKELPGETEDSEFCEYGHWGRQFEDTGYCRKHLRKAARKA